MVTERKPCCVEGCEESSHWREQGRKGLCTKHYTRLLRHGSPTGGRTHVGEPMDFLKNKVIPYSGGDCLIWPYAKNNAGYGRISANGKMELVSRIVCTHVKGPPPSDRHECRHLCGNGHLGCCNPNHLEWGTASENSNDRWAHGTYLHGEKMHLSTISNDTARKIKAATGNNSEVAKRFGTTRKVVSHIRLGVSWKHV